MPPKLKHTVALDAEGRILTLLEYQRSTARPEKVFCVCGCRQPLTLRKSRNLPNKRHIITHFALRGTTRNTCRVSRGETFEHIRAKQLIVDNIYKIEFARLRCPTCRGLTQRVRFPPDVYARLEHRNIETNCIPDVTVYNSQGCVCFALEVRKTHAVPQHKLDLMQDHNLDVAEFDADDVIDCLCDEDDSCDTVHLHNLLCCSVECSACAEAREIRRQRNEEKEERERKRSEEAEIEDAKRVAKQKQEERNLLEIVEESWGWFATADQFEEHDRPRRIVALQTARDKVEVLQYLPQKKYEHGFKKCGSCKRWVHGGVVTAFQLDQSKLEDIGVESTSFTFTKHYTCKVSMRSVNACEDCCVDCYVCGAHTLIRLVGKYGRCGDCSRILGLARRGMLECDTLRHMNARQFHWIFKAMPQVLLESNGIQTP